MNYQESKDKIKKIKVKLDHKTIVWLRSMKSYLQWKKRYPQAQIIKD